MLAVLVAIYASQQEGVLTREELNLDSVATLTLLLVATGQMLVILLGGIDLSVGGVVSVTTALAATQFGGGGSGMLLWAVAIVALGAAAGAANGVLIARLKLQPVHRHARHVVDLERRRVLAAPDRGRHDPRVVHLLGSPTPTSVSPRPSGSSSP